MRANKMAMDIHDIEQAKFFLKNTIFRIRRLHAEKTKES